MRFLLSFDQVEFFFFSFTGTSNARFDGMVEISMTCKHIQLAFMSGVSSTVGNLCCVLQSIVNRLMGGVGL